MRKSRREAWRAGVVAAWYLRDSQLDIYYLFQRQKKPFVEAARRFGKTTSIAAFVLEQLRKNPGWICRWCFPFKNQARDVLFKEIAQLQQDCPDNLKFKYHSTDSVFIGPGDSRIYIRGVNEDRGESARGAAANIIICDEYGFWVDADYIVRSVLSPQFDNQEGRWLIKASTPPPDLDHVYYREREEAFLENRFIQKTIMDNESLTEEEFDEIVKECGGVNTPAFRRERLCEAVADPQKIIIREFSEELNVVEDDYSPPNFFTPYVGGDHGHDDNTAILFGWHDFAKNEVVIDTEYLTSNEKTSVIVQNAKRIEKELWGDLKPHRRVYDANKQLIFDMATDHGYSMIFPNKDDRIAAINELRIEVSERRFKIKKRCRNLIRQMRVGMWKDERHSDFQRSKELGHLDALAAAIYFNRAVDRTRNPVPHGYGLDREKVFIPPHSSYQEPTYQALKAVFGARKGFR